MLPVKDSTVTTGFGKRLTGFHVGIDLASIEGSEVVSMLDGNVIKAGKAHTDNNRCDGGVGVVIRSGGFAAYYGNIIPSVRLGSGVQAGEVIGHMVAGRVHVEVVDDDGVFIDPMVIIDKPKPKKPRVKK